MKIMSNLSSARLREETPHNSDALKRRAQSIINDKSLDAETRTVIRYGLEQTTRGSEIWYGASMEVKVSSTISKFFKGVRQTAQ
jgi:hypothetical protein